MASKISLLFSKFKYGMKSLELGPVRRIDHVVIHCPEPEKLFSFLTEQLRLPYQWPMGDYGRYTCGGVCVGNTVLEILKWSAKPYAGPAYPQGLALEPWDLNTALGMMSRRKIAGGQPFVKFGKLPNGKEGRVYTNVVIPSLMDEGDCGFICDYSLEIKEKKRLLFETHGPVSKLPLTIFGVTEIAIAQKNYNQVTLAWEQFMAPAKPVSEGEWNIDGIRVKFLSHAASDNKSITLGAKSLEQAKTLIETAGLKATNVSPKKIRLEGTQLQGLKVFIEEILGVSATELNPYDRA